MKIRILGFFLIGLICVATGACKNEAQKKVDELVKTTGQQCPIEVPANIAGTPGDVKIESIKYSGNTVKYKVQVGTAFNIDALKNNPEIKNLVVNALAANHDRQVMEQMQICREAGAKVCMVLVDNNGNEYEIEIDPADIK